MSRSAKAFLATLWLCFAVRLLFYAAVLPIWEGLDEWAHFAYVDHLRQTGHSPSKKTPLSGEVAASFSLLPLAPHLPDALGAGISHEQYWQLDADEREKRQSALRMLRVDEPPHPAVSAANYQAQHPPLAYWLLGAIDRTLGFESIPARVFALRFALIGVASLCLPLLWILAQRVFAHSSLPAASCLVLALTPGFAVYVSRISNDALAAFLLSAAMVVYLRSAHARAGQRTAWASAAITSATMLSKAYGVLLVPVYAVKMILDARHGRGLRNALYGAASFGGIVLLLTGWWYFPVLSSTGTLSGEQFDVAATATPLAGRISNLFRIRWWLVWLYGSNSHIWISGWSFLMLQEWMYWIFRSVGILAAAGFVLAAFRRVRRGRTLESFTRWAFWQVPFPLTCLFLAAVAFQGWQIFNARGDSTAQGWYLYGAVNGEIVVIVAGLGYAFGAHRTPRLAAALALLLGALDLFTVHVLSVPFYAGLTSRSVQGRTPLLGLSQWPEGGIPEIATRLAANHPSWLPPEALLALWIIYLAATFALLGLSFFLLLRKSNCDNKIDPSW